MTRRLKPHLWDDSPAYAVQVASKTHNASRKRMSVLEKHNNELEELKSKRQALKNLSTNTTQLQTNQGLKKNNPAVKASPTTSKVVITVNKPYMESKLGLGIDPFGSSVKIRNIKHDSLFRGSALKVGDTLDSINGIKYASFKMGKLLLQAAPAGPLTVVAVSTDADDTCVEPLQVTAAAQRETTLPVMQHVGEKQVTKKSPENSNLMQFPWPIELPSTGVVALRGKISTKHNSVVQMFKGEWAFGIDIITGKTEGLTEPFEYQMGLPVSGGGITFDGKFQYSGKDINDKFVLNCNQNRGGYWNVFGKGENKFGDFSVEGTIHDKELTLGRTYVVVDTSTPPVSSLQERSLRSRNIPLGSPSSSKFERVAVLCCGLISLSLTMSLLDCEAAEEEVSAAISSNLAVDKENLAQVRNK